QHLGAYEVVFGTPPEPEAEAEPEQAPAAMETVDLNAELNLLRAQLDDIKRTLKVGGSSALPRFSQPELDDACQELIDAGLDSTLAREIITEASADWLFGDTRGAGETLRSNAIEKLRKRLKPLTGASLSARNARIILFVGPPGAGKTSALAKVAVREGLAQ